MAYILSFDRVHEAIMSEYPHLKNAPIREAVVDIQVELPQEALSNLDKLKKLYSSDYPISKELIGVELKIQTTTESRSASQAINRMGLRFETKDGGRVVLAQLDRMVFSRLKKYYDWDDLIDNAKKAWGKYERTMQPVRVKRLAVRYINQIRSSNLEWEEILSILPQTPDDLKLSVSGFTSQTLLRDKSGANIILTLAKKDKLEPVIIDIDVYKEVDVLPKAFGTIWKTIDSYQAIKNEVFF